MTKEVYFTMGLFFILSNCTTKQNKFDKKEDEPLFANIDSNELNYKRSVETAQSQISFFLRELKIKTHTSTACVKTFLPDKNGKRAFIWLVNPVFNLDTCIAEIFEIPEEFADYKSGDKLKFVKKDIQDWYILDIEGRMLGGYSLRYMRQRLSAKEQIEFDKYIGVKVYL
jgi:uncharacterized protein YegJ (DUF2314 family)